MRLLRCVDEHQSLRKSGADAGTEAQQGPDFFGCTVSREHIEHEPVLCRERMATVAPQPGETVVDVTCGHGGHALILAEAVKPDGRLIGLDIDPINLERAKQRLREAMVRTDLLRENFVQLGDALDSLGIGKVDVILADLGVSTDQLLDPSVGLGFTEDSPLDMRLDDRLEKSATDLVNALSEDQLSDLIYFNSQERFSRRIARKICHARRDHRIRTTGELVRAICSALEVSPDAYHGKIHPATRTFLALRIAVNNELVNLETFLGAARDRLSPGGRLAVMSFHSGEDRLVKQSFLDGRKDGTYEILTKKPVCPSADEVRTNPRSRSAKLRVAKRLP